ncbi:hypothetical protein LOZ22_003542 [Ophidiomyces ophidiicola]|nr:hypothetical protein LOZ22_003542 [Ophidiomyces ophidiicola]
MASVTPSTHAGPSTSEMSDIEGLKVQVLSPSFQTGARVSFTCAATTTVLDLKAMIKDSLNTRPPPETQRLIYRGKELINTEETLANFLELGNGETHSIHLVLPPGTALIAIPDSEVNEPNTPRVPKERSSPFRAQRVEDLLNPVVPDESPHVSERQYEATGSTIRHRFATADNDTRGRSDTYSHLDSSYGSSIFLNDGASSSSRQPFSNSSYTTRQRANVLPMADFGLSSNTGLHEPRLNLPVGSSSSPQITSSINTYQVRHRPEATKTGHTSTIPCGEFPREIPRLETLSQTIIQFECQVNLGMTPAVDEISRVRSQIYQILDAQHRAPLAPRDSALEGWIARLSALDIRADQLRIMNARQQLSGNQHTNSGPVISGTSSTNASYLLSAPNGLQYLLTRSHNQQTPAAHHRTPGATSSTPNPSGNIAPFRVSRLAAPHPTNRIFRPVVRRRNRRYVRAINVAAVVRSIWLFVRLYFSSYLLTAQGSWLRAIAVVASVIIALLSETEYPRQIQHSVINPILQHLENLVPLHREPHAAQRQEAENAAGNLNNTGDGVERNGVPVQVNRGSLWDGVRSLERSIAIFIASFVPGLSERHIAARNAAEAARRNEQQESPPDQDQRHQEVIDDTDQRRNEGGDEFGNANFQNGRDMAAPNGVNAPEPTR